MHEEKPTGDIDPRQEAALECQFEQAKRERDQLRLDMVSRHKIAKDMVKRHGEETCRLLGEIEEWKTASGLEKGGDPDAVTPDALRDELAHLLATQEKSWSAADEAALAEYEAIIRGLADVCDKLMGDTDLLDDDSPEMKAMQRAAAFLGARRQGKSMFDLKHEDPCGFGHE